MSAHDINIVRHMHMKEFIGNEDNIDLLRQYADVCDPATAAGLKRLIIRLKKGW